MVFLKMSMTAMFFLNLTKIQDLVICSACKSKGTINKRRAHFAEKLC